MNIDLSGRNALVCGSSQGIGYSIAKIFSECGANITLLARNEEALIKAVDTLDISSGNYHNYVVADFTDTDLVKNQIQKYLNTGNLFHILVNNTGGPAPGLISEADSQSFIHAFNMHLINSQNLTKELLPGMINERFGRIINVISISVKQPIENLGVSNTIRGAMASWSKTMSKELAGYGITVNNILPGYTNTERLKSLFKKNAESQNVSPEDIEKKILTGIPAGRIAAQNEPAYLAAFLASDYASYINGVSIPVDGGFLSCI